MDKPVIDESVYRALEESTGAEFVGDLVGTFLAEAPRMLVELGEAHRDGHAERFRRTAHSLKSNASTFGATELAALARELELGGLDADRNRDAARLSALEAEFGQVAAALKVMVHG